jgi:hypothetical protein
MLRVQPGRKRRVRPTLAHQAQGERFADECDEQREKVGAQRERRLTPIVIAGDLFKTLQVVIGIQPHVLQRGCFSASQGQRPAHKRCKALGAGDGDERISQPLAQSRRFMYGRVG